MSCAARSAAPTPPTRSSTYPAHRKPLWTITARTPDSALRSSRLGDALATYEAQYDAMRQPRRIQARRGFSDFLMDLAVMRIHADGSAWTGTWLESRIGFAGVEQSR